MLEHCARYLHRLCLLATLHLPPCFHCDQGCKIGRAIDCDKEVLPVLKVMVFPVPGWYKFQLMSTVEPSMKRYVLSCMSGSDAHGLPLSVTAATHYITSFALTIVMISAPVVSGKRPKQQLQRAAHYG